LQRCNNICERCGKYPVEDIHHLTYARVYHEDLADLQGLCTDCHGFVHGYEAKDGLALYQEFQKAEAALQEKVDRALDELTRFCEHPECYRSFIDVPPPPQRELLALLRQYPRLLGIGGCAEKIVEVRVARRTYETAVAFKRWFKTDDGCSGFHAEKSAELALKSRHMVLDTERELWIILEDQRAFVGRFRGDHALPAQIRALPKHDYAAEWLAQKHPWRFRRW
jgi:hypothetical protein